MFFCGCVVGVVVVCLVGGVRVVLGCFVVEGWGGVCGRLG